MNIVNDCLRRAYSVPGTLPCKLVESGTFSHVSDFRVRENYRWGSTVHGHAWNQNSKKYQKTYPLLDMISFHADTLENEVILNMSSFHADTPGNEVILNMTSFHADTPGNEVILHTVCQGGLETRAIYNSTSLLSWQQHLLYFRGTGWG